MKLLLFCNTGFEMMEFALFIDVFGWARNDYGYDSRFLNLISLFDAKGKYIASVCVGALPIGKSGVLRGRNATTYHLDHRKRQKQLAEFGVHVIPDERVVRDGKIITSFCPETAADVAFELLACLSCWHREDENCCRCNGI